MLMSKIRHSRKKYRGVLIVVISLLIISLISTFALLGSSAGTGGNAQGAEQAKLQAEALEKIIKEAEDVTDKDYSANSNLASYYTSLASAYGELGDSRSQEASLKAAEYFRAAMDTAPAEMNDLGKAQLYASMAVSYYAGGDNVMATAAFNEALALAPDNFEIARDYSYFLFGTQGIDEAINYLEGYKEAALEEGKETAGVDEMLNLYKSLQDAFKDAEKSENQDDAGNTGTEENTENGSDVE